MQSQRDFRNVRLTKRFHFRYFGLWVLLCAGLIVLTDVALFEFIRGQRQDAEVWARLFEKDYRIIQGAFIGTMVCISVFMSAAVILLAVITAHRIAGPFIRLLTTFRAVKDGDMSQRLRFRQYDRLDGLARDFNEMMDSLPRSGK
jgi:nitrogen fixation/metabolism regulation signal transduction histidine kinase